ncbi:MAG TPA: FoF1 ATP synthase subunit gamma [Trinickia sp.]|uniref:F0F1 ATP synthase subunit gamma n=1 Tax=Trinickia sp. TaxID=2571163 RepID=UPI002CDA611D|nr:FoF1 ATP synthase subunit gamma [Trinickia sp.]HVW48816.1 FoF1 ATP synthase subunit gamma [Trinickia sp.]
MSNELGVVQARLGTVGELASVVTAMRGIAAARTRDALERLPGIRACADQISAAIADAMTLALPLPSELPTPARTSDTQILIVIGTEQGFVGAYNHRVMQAARRPSADAVEYFIVGDRAQLVAEEFDYRASWSAEMAAHVDAVPELAGRIVGALYGRLQDGGVSRVALVHGAPQPVEGASIATTSLLPFDFGRFEAVHRRLPPIVALPVRELLERLAEEYVYTQICEAIVLSFAAESEARMRTMMAARRNIDETALQLTMEYRRLRQEQITAEIVELSGVDTRTETLGA